jgi:Domain of unknown function (DUF2703)
MITGDILYDKTCEHYSKTIQYVKNVLLEEGIEAIVNEVDVTSAEQARRLNFIGSPTVRINGEDIESEAEQKQGHIHGSCRMYNYKGQISVTPNQEQIRAAIKKHQ